jgi:CelD/BcsL family acetyltransferase involved in cellulose biosynthesis
MKLGQEWSSRIVRPSELSSDDIDLWATFCGTDPSLAHPFFSFAFARAVDRVRPHVRIAVLQKRGGTIGFLPFQFSGWATRALAAAERVGGDVADRFGVIAGTPLGLSSGELLHLAGLNSVSYSFLPVEQLRHGLARQRAITGQRVRLPRDADADADAFWTTLKATSRKFAYNVERSERLVTKGLGPIEFTPHADPATELQRLIDMKGAQYLRTEGTNPLAPTWKAELFRELLRNPSPHCTATLTTLYAGGHWLASHLGLMSGTALHYWYPVYNPTYAQLSPGNILAKHLLLSAIPAGIEFFDLGGYGHYKDHFRPESYEYYAGFWRSGRVLGLISQAGKSLEWRIAHARRQRRRARAADAQSPIQ